MHANDAQFVRLGPRVHGRLRRRDCVLFVYDLGHADRYRQCDLPDAALDGALNGPGARRLCDVLLFAGPDGADDFHNRPFTVGCFRR